VPGEREEVEDGEEVDQRRDDQHQVSSSDQLVCADLTLDRSIQGVQVMQLEDCADFEERERHCGAHRREQQIAEQKAGTQHQLPRTVVEELGDHGVGHERQDNNFCATRAYGVFESIHP
jgi:hypothetical protein